MGGGAVIFVHVYTNDVIKEQSLCKYNQLSRSPAESVEQLWDNTCWLGGSTSPRVTAPHTHAQPAGTGPGSVSRPAPTLCEGYARGSWCYTVCTVTPQSSAETSRHNTCWNSLSNIKVYSNILYYFNIQFLGFSDLHKFKFKSFIRQKANSLQYKHTKWWTLQWMNNTGYSYRCQIGYWSNQTDTKWDK